MAESSADRLKRLRQEQDQRDADARAAADKADQESKATSRAKKDQQRLGVEADQLHQLNDSIARNGRAVDKLLAGNPSRSDLAEAQRLQDQIDAWNAERVRRQATVDSIAGSGTQVDFSGADTQWDPNQTPAPSTPAPSGGNAPGGPPEANWVDAPVNTYTPQQLADFARQAGFSGPALTQAVAVALAESGGASEQSTYPGEQSFGVTQINVPWHPQYNAQKLLDDPVYAFRAMYEISNGGKDFSAWTTVSGNKAINLAPGAYKDHMAVASAATGGATGGSVAATAAGTRAVTDDLPPNATPEQIQSYVEKHYPQAAPFFANDEIRSILTDAARNHLDDTEVEARLRQTNYWQTHGAPSRKFDAQIANDPQGAGQLVEDTKKSVVEALARNGIQVGDDQAGTIAKQAIRAGWIDSTGAVANHARFDEFTANMLRQRSQFFRVSGDTMLRNLDGSTVKASDASWASKLADGTYLVDSGTKVANLDNTTSSVSQTGATAEHVALPGGEASAQADNIEAIAKKYGVPLSRSSAEDWALRVLDGSASSASFLGWVTAQAKGRWAGDPNVLSAIDQGISPSTYFSATRDHIAQLWNVDPNTIDVLNDPKYMAITQMVDPKTGQRRSMTLGEADQWARDQDQYTQTQTYKSDKASALLNMKAFVEGRAA